MIKIVAFYKWPAAMAVDCQPLSDNRPEKGHRISVVIQVR